jgi:hypothetical protein
MYKAPDQPPAERSILARVIEHLVIGAIGDRFVQRI